MHKCPWAAFGRCEKVFVSDNARKKEINRLGNVFYIGKKN